MQVVENGQARARYGCIVSFENADGRTLVLHRIGPTRTALRRACEDALELDETFRVVSFSTPQTVYRDLQGTRPGTMNEEHDPLSGRAVTPEALMLGNAGIPGMLHPRLKR